MRCIGLQCLSANDVVKRFSICGLYVLLASISFFSFLKINLWAKRSYDPLNRLLPNFHHMVGIWSYIADLTPFSDGLRNVVTVTNVRSKLAKSDYLPLFVALAFWKGLQHRHSDLQQFICDDLATTPCVNLVNFDPVGLTPEFKRVVGVHSSFKNNKPLETTSFSVKIGEIGQFTFIHRLGIPKTLQSISPFCF